MLEPGERVLWSGRPAPGLTLRPADGFLIPFSLAWCGFAIFWEVSVLRIPNAPFFFPLFGAAFVAAGLYIVFGRFFVDARLRSGMVYAVTDRRVVIISGLMRRQVRSLFLEGLAEVNLSVRRDGKGTLAFGRDALPAWWMRGNLFYGSGANSAPSFELIDAPQRVMTVIRDAQRSLAGRP